MSNLFDLSDAERRRHDALVGVLGDPSTVQEGELCVFFSRWLGASDVETWWAWRAAKPTR